MRRRELLAGAGTAAGGLAGLDRVRIEDATIYVFDGSDDDERPSDDADAEPTVAGYSLERGEQDCAGGDDEDEATVAFADGTVVVEGRIETPTPCHELEVAEAAYDADGDVLELEVAVGDAGDEFCVQCLGIVEYAVRIDVEGPDPGRVTVVHDRHGEAIEVASVAAEDD